MAHYSLRNSTKGSGEPYLLSNLVTNADFDTNKKIFFLNVLNAKIKNKKITLELLIFISMSLHPSSISIHV